MNAMNVNFTLLNCLVKSPGPLIITTSPVLAAGKVGLPYNHTVAAAAGFRATHGILMQDQISCLLVWQ
jgi:hypothetical protein